MKSQLSAFMDDELPAEELEELLTKIGKDDSATSWRHYELMHSLITDDSSQLSRTGLYSAELTEKIMLQVSGDASLTEEVSQPQSAKVLPFPQKIRRWVVPASVAASAMAAAVFMGNFDSGGQSAQIAKNSQPPVGLTASSTVSAPAPDLTATELARSDLASLSVKAGNPSAADPLTRSREPVENQVIPELNEFILQHNSIASSRQFQPALSYARVVSHRVR